MNYSKSPNLPLSQKPPAGRGEKGRYWAAAFFSSIFWMK